MHLVGIAHINSVGRPVNVSGNQLHNLRAQSSSTEAQNLIGVSYNASGGFVNVGNNIIEGLYNGTNGVNSNGITSGIWIRASQNATVVNNSIQNLNSAFGNNQTDFAAAVSGIVAYATTDLFVSENTIYNLTSSRNDNNISLQAIGMVVSKSETGNEGLVFRNFIHSISVASQNPGAHINGMRIRDGVNLTLFNNIVHLGTTSAAARTIYGIYDHGSLSGTTRLYYNTVSISGNGVAANNNSYALWSNNGTNNKDYRNNVFSNTRSTPEGSGGQNFAAFYTQTPSDPWISDYNNYYVNGTRSMLLHLAGADYASLPAWQTATTRDAHSLSVDPVFALPGGSDPANYIPSAAMPGLTGLGSITDDFGTDVVRTDPVTMGAWENDCKLVITEQPADLIRCENDNATFTVVATGVGTPSYLWEFSTDNGVTWNVVPGQTPPGSNTLSIVAAAPGLYRCVITFANDPDPPCVIVSDWAELTVNPRPTTSAIWHQ